MTFTDTDSAIKALENVGIECRVQHTYFGDEVCVHLHGNNSPATIYPSITMFLNWINYFDIQSLGQNDRFSEDDYEF